MSSIDIPAFIEAYGLPGFMIIVLMWVANALWKRLNEQTDSRFADHKEHSAQMAENTKTLDQALKYIEGKSRG